MNTSELCAAAPRARICKALHTLAAALGTSLIAVAASAEVSQTPLYLGGGNVPGNLVLVPSVEWPTINSVANLGAYDENREYLGYFDADKCYAYDHRAGNQVFVPVRFASNPANHRCGGDYEWSGNFLNWAATQTIDPFRWVLTGGHRVVDTPTTTWLEKARHDGQGGTNIYPNRRVPAGGSNATLVRNATPFHADSITLRIQGLGNEMRFKLEAPDGDGLTVNGESFDNHDAFDDDDDDGDGIDDDREPYDVSVRVAVCTDEDLLEANCRAYEDGYKPEGLIQQYADELRLSVFGYLNDHSMLRDGGALRARQKFVGPTMIVPGEPGREPNPNLEWDAETGVLVQNPDTEDASDTNAAIVDSGVINYLNKFGQMTGYNHKQYDPVSELYYAALRYLKNQPNVPQYTSIGGPDAYRLADGFPVITDWDDPIQYACQKNVVLGIGDVYTHRDKNLPGSSFGADEPSKPSLVADDDTVDVMTWTERVGALEGLAGIVSDGDWSGRNNSAFVAGLAYYANTTDIRPGDDDIPGTQTVSTHWVDVLEAQTLEPPVENQYYLATKYGGFEPPDDFDPEDFDGPMALDWWHTTGEILTPFGSRANNTNPFPRPDNYYVAGGADQMVESLTTAFARISAELRSSASSVAANSTRVGSDTAVFQAAFDSHRWSGELQAFRIDSDGTIDDEAEWNAATEIDALTDADMASRKIFTSAPPTTVEGDALLTTAGLDFTWLSLADSQRDALRAQPGGGSPVSEAIGQQRLDYVRGDRSLELPDGPYRQRASRLGDIVNSDPQFIHHQDFGYTLLAHSGAFSSDVAAAYRTFRQSSTYQNRPPMVIVGANDGMLHGFHAGLGTEGGGELFAFVPHDAIDGLYELTLPAYSHRYFVDGPPRIADAWLGEISGWRTLAVGISGAGGNSVFALDVTDPESMTSSDFLWEFTHPDMGYTLGQPSVAPLPNGEFGVIVTSGYEAPGPGRIWILDPASGMIVKSFTLPGSGDVGAPLVVDLNGDRVADRIYVGDTQGKLWRFDLDGGDPSDWDAPDGLLSGGEPQPLFIATDAAGDPQAITAPLTSAFNDHGEHTVFFGTGSFYRVDDNVVPPNPPVDTFYGVIDRGTPIASRDDLVEQEILTEQVVNGMQVRGVTANEMEPGDSGWYLDLVWNVAKGERVVSRALVRDDRVIVTTLIPDPDPCAPGGESWLMELDAFTGGRLDYTVFDLNIDGDFDAEDMITVTVDGEDVLIAASAVLPDIGIIDTPAVISGMGDEQADELKVVSGATGELMGISERGAINVGRQSWRQLR